MPVLDTSIKTKLVDGSTDLGGKGWVLKDYIIDVYPNLIPGVKTPALWMWGLGGLGQLGDNNTNPKSSPVQTIAGGVNWKQVACGSITAGVKTDGTLWVWGRNTNGHLGDNTSISRSSPVQTVAGGTNWTQASADLYLSAGVKSDGTLWTWGRNLQGSVGDNSTIPRSSPVQTVAGGTNWTQVSCGYNTCGCIKSDVTLWTWGRNINGQVGDNTAASKSSPVQTVTRGTTWKQVSCGYNVTAGVKTDGTLWLWGLGTSGQLGDNTIVSKSSPIQTVAGGTNWAQVSCGNSHCAGVKSDGTLWLWGSNIGGRLGDNTIISKSSPIQTISGGSTWKQVSCGYTHTACIKSDGTLWAWGSNQNGSCGDNTVVARSSPVQTVTPMTTWKQVSCVATTFSSPQSRTAAIADGNY